MPIVITAAPKMGLSYEEMDVMIAAIALQRRNGRRHARHVPISKTCGIEVINPWTA